MPRHDLDERFMNTGNDDYGQPKDGPEHETIRLKDYLANNPRNTIERFDAPPPGHNAPVVLHESILRAMGFSSSFATDPQERPASKKFQKGDFVLFMPNEEEQEFITSENEQIKDVAHLILLIKQAESSHPELVTMEKVGFSSGIPELDELVEQYQRGEISFTVFATRVWNKGYSAGHYEFDPNNPPVEIPSVDRESAIK